MWFGIIIITVIVVGFLAVSLWLKESYEKKHNIDCELEEGTLPDNDSCSHCGIKDIANCSHNQ